MFTEQRALWIYDQYRWLERCLPRRRKALRLPLVVPTATFFPERYTNTHESAEQVFNRVRSLMGMGAWDCAFVQKGGEKRQLTRALQESGVLGEIPTPGEPAGTFSVRERVTITYAPHLLADPLILVAVVAHELSHYLLATAAEKPACSKEDMEPLTDLTAVFEGFGLFSCYAAFQFKQWTDVGTQGWSVSRLGYMTEAEFAFAIGVFCVRNEIDHALAAKYLKPNPRQVFLDALDYVDDLETNRKTIDPPNATTWVRIVGVPPGEAPAEIREEWLGLALPLAFGRSGACQLNVQGILSRTGNPEPQMGYVVLVEDAIDALEEKSPKAAAWWRSNTPQLVSRGRTFLFQEAVCELIGPKL
ncbi:MAG TPA: hypothetical protein VK717_00805 [Opitutaceae bacterium]|jgi:hypothetical protein|nr:hypothetical protein [Opitutaceae bacterium]